MQVNYTERYASITDAQKKKAAAKFAKIHRILSANRDLEAHVIFSKNGSNVEAEVTLHALHHTLVVTDRNGDAFVALNHALTKLEKQAVKNKNKLIETRRPSRQSGEPSPAVAGIDSSAASCTKQRASIQAPTFRGISSLPASHADTGAAEPTQE